MTDVYGHGRMPANGRDGDLSRVDRVPYGRFRNVYVYITEACQLRCRHCYMGDRLHRALRMPYDEVLDVLRYWRRLGGSKLTILGGEPTVHPRYADIVRAASSIGYEHVITTSNGWHRPIASSTRSRPATLLTSRSASTGAAPHRMTRSAAAARSSGRSRR